MYNCQLTEHNVHHSIPEQFVYRAGWAQTLQQAAISVGIIVALADCWLAVGQIGMHT
jgi:hypothetical protein